VSEVVNNAPLSESIKNIDSCLQHLLEGTDAAITPEVSFKDISNILLGISEHPKIKNVTYQMTNFGMPMGQPIPPMEPVSAPV